MHAKIEELVDIKLKQQVKNRHNNAFHRTQLSNGTECQIFMIPNIYIGSKCSCGN